jgi:Zn-dependent protease
MKKHLFLSVICFFLLVLLVAVPALAATITCPYSCSCLLPSDAKNLGYSGYCSDKQQVCGYDMQKTEKYCYTKPVTISTVRELIVTVRPFVTTTITPTPVPVTCPSGCSCFTLEEGKKNGYSLCGGKQILCGYDTTRQPQYCHQLPVTVTATTAPLPVACPLSCFCFTLEEGRINRYSLCGGKQILCGYANLQPQYCHQPPVSVTTTTTISVIRDVSRLPTNITTAVPVTIKGVSGSPCFETYIESGSLKINNDGSLICSVQITSRDGSGAVLLHEGTEVFDSNNHPVPILNIIRTDSKDLPSVPSDENFRYVGYAYDCLPDGTRFGNPVMISISPSEEDWSTMNGDDLIIRGFNSGESSWENQSTTIHANERKITAELSHFSIFALFSRQPIENTSSSYNTTIAQPAGIQWKGTPLSLVIPPEYAPLAAVTFGMVLIIGGALAPDSGIFQKIRKFFDIIDDYVKSTASGLISRIEIEKRKISPHISGSYVPILTFRELAVIACSAAIFAIAFIFKDKMGVQWSTLLIFLIMGGLATIVHELGHRLSGRYYGYPSELQIWSLGSVTMLITAWFFGTVFAQPSRTVMQGIMKEADFHEVIVTVVGPLMNLVFAGISFLLLPLGGYLTIMGKAGFSMNLLSSVCSLIPVKPMDGERVFRWNKLLWALIWLPIFVIYCIFFIF